MKIICKNCGWSWNRNDGGVNPCKCHKCGYNNMYGKKIVGLGSVSEKWSVLGFFKDKELAQNELKKEIASQKRMVKEFPDLKKYIRVFKIEKKEGGVYVIFSKK